MQAKTACGVCSNGQPALDDVSVGNFAGLAMAPFPPWITPAQLLSPSAFPIGAVIWYANLMLDGQSWQLDIAYDKNKQIVFAGRSGYPSLESVNVVRTTVNRFGLLLHFVDITLLTARYDMRNYSESDAQIESVRRKLLVPPN